MIQRCRAMFVLVALGLSVVCHAEDPTMERGRQLLSSLNLAHAALGPVIDHANEAARQRLMQLDEIIQSAIANTNEMLKQRIDQLDAAARARIDQAFLRTRTVIDQVDANIKDNTILVSEQLDKRIEQMQGELGNIVAAGPWSFDPLVNAQGKGLFVVKEKGEVTRVFVSGVGLFKYDTPPSVSLVLGHSAPVPLRVTSHTMALIEVEVPSSMLGDASAQTDAHLQLKLRRSRFLPPWYSHPEIPLHLCGMKEGYKARVTTTATGQKWEYRTIVDPNQDYNVKGYARGYYYASQGSNNVNVAFCATATDGWEVDKERAGFNYGLQVKASGGDPGASLGNKWLGNGCHQLYCVHPCHTWAGDVTWAQKRLTPSASSCGAASVKEFPIGFGRNQVAIDSEAAVHECVKAPGNGVAIAYRMEVLSSRDEVVEMMDLSPLVPARALGGALHAKLSDSGLLDVDLSRQCSSPQ